jgi:hypothetical protein
MQHAHIAVLAAEHAVVALLMVIGMVMVMVMVILIVVVVLTSPSLRRVKWLMRSLAM